MGDLRDKVVHFGQQLCSVSQSAFLGKWGLSPVICDKAKLHFLPSWSFLTQTHTFPGGAKQPQDTEHKAVIFNSACEND